MTIKERKLTALNEILTAYEVYKGQNQSKLLSLLDKLQQSKKLSNQETVEIMAAVADHRQRLLDILAQSPRVKVYFDYFKKSEPAVVYRDDIDELWKDLE